MKGPTFKFKRNSNPGFKITNSRTLRKEKAKTNVQMPQIKVPEIVNNQRFFQSLK